MSSSVGKQKEATSCGETEKYTTLNRKADKQKDIQLRRTEGYSREDRKVDKQKDKIPVRVYRKECTQVDRQECSWLVEVGWWERRLWCRETGEQQYKSPDRVADKVRCKKVERGKEDGKLYRKNRNWVDIQVHS